MTATTLPEERERCLNSGMNDYLSKPSKPDNLLALLKKYHNAAVVKPEKSSI